MELKNRFYTHMVARALSMEGGSFSAVARTRPSRSIQQVSGLLAFDARIREGN